MTLEGVHGLTPVVRHRKAVAGLAIFSSIAIKD
jgi:hypothetical protein